MRAYVLSNSLARVCPCLDRYYTQRLWGITHADYDYSVVNDLLHQNVKGHVKKVATRPEAIRARSVVPPLDFVVSPSLTFANVRRDFRRCRDPGPDGGVAFRSSEVSRPSRASDHAGCSSGL